MPICFTRALGGMNRRSLHELVHKRWFLRYALLFPECFRLQCVQCVDTILFLVDRCEAC